MTSRRRPLAGKSHSLPEIEDANILLKGPPPELHFIILHDLLGSGDVATLLIAYPDSVRMLAEQGTKDDRISVLLQLARDPLIDQRLSYDIVEPIARGIHWKHLQVHYSLFAAERRRSVTDLTEPLSHQQDAHLIANDHALEARKRRKWQELEEADKRLASLDRYATFYLLLLRHGLISKATAFLDILRVFFQLASSASQCTSSADFCYGDDGRSVQMELESISHLDEILKNAIRHSNGSRNRYILEEPLANDILAAFALRVDSQFLLHILHTADDSWTAIHPDMNLLFVHALASANPDTLFYFDSLNITCTKAPVLITRVHTVVYGVWKARNHLAIYMDVILDGMYQSFWGSSLVKFMLNIIFKRRKVRVLRDLAYVRGRHSSILRNITIED
eukprot:6214326-Pleurochrysis_carterae.AAC.1